MKRNLISVHIGEDIWTIGGKKNLKDRGLHAVIYAPNKKLYDVWEEDVNYIFEDNSRAIHSKLKIYILTHILDNKENWCFDLSIIPDKGQLKVIYDNGTVRNIEFNGEFQPQEIISDRQTWDEGVYFAYSNRPYSSLGKLVNPIAYRKDNDETLHYDIGNLLGQLKVNHENQYKK